MRGSGSSSRSTAVRRGAARWFPDFRRTRPRSARRPPSKGARRRRTMLPRRDQWPVLLRGRGVRPRRAQAQRDFRRALYRFEQPGERRSDCLSGYEVVAFSASSPELDKTALAVDIPRTTATCTLQAPQGDGTSVTQRFRPGTSTWRTRRSRVRAGPRPRSCSRDPPIVARPGARRLTSRREPG